MHNSATCCLVILALSLTACSKSEEDAARGNSSTAQQQSGPVLVEAKDGAAVSIAPPPSVSAPASVAPPGSLSPAPLATGSKDEYNGAVVARDDDGKRLDGEALLKKAMMYHVEGQGHPYPTRIEELVELGTLKSLPPAPNGQKWAIDPNTKQIVLK